LLLAFIEVSCPYKIHSVSYRSLHRAAKCLCNISGAERRRSWLGSLNVPGGSLRIVFNISRKADSTLTATLDSPDQGAKGIPADEVTVTDDSLHVGVKAIAGLFRGKVEDSTVTGEWSQGGRSFPLDLKRIAAEPELVRPQEPKKPYPYLEEEVAFFNSKGGDTLAGTLTKPNTGGPFTTVLLITGSGPQDRDEFIAGHKPFLVIADYLTRQGIAVLRVDDRGVGKSTGKFAQAPPKLLPPMRKPAWRFSKRARMSIPNASASSVIVKARSKPT